MIEPHKHDGINNTLTEGQFVFFPITTTVPTDAATEGSIRIYVDSLSSPTVWRLYVRAAQTWKYRVLNNT
jgi:hypothetical protein